MNKERYWVWLNEGDMEYFMKNSGGKNLLTHTVTTQTKNGVTLTVNADGSITANGTAKASVIVNLTTIATLGLTNGNYILSGCPAGGSALTYRLDITRTPGSTLNDIGQGVRFTVGGSDYTPNQIRLIILKDAVCNNVVFKPMIRDGSISNNEYAPYIPTNQQLYEMIQTLSGNRNMTLAKAATTEGKTEEKE